MSPQAYTIPQFCAAYGVGRTTVYELFKLRKLTRRKIGRRTVIARADAERWFNSL